MNYMDEARALVKALAKEMKSIAGEGLGKDEYVDSGKEAEARLRIRGEWRPSWDFMLNARNPTGRAGQ